jgi:hypothetical protein
MLGGLTLGVPVLVVFKALGNRPKIRNGILTKSESNASRWSGFDWREAD